MSICAIVAVDENWGIGYKGDLLISLPEDQKQNFKVKTMGHPVIYGRKTLDTFPGGRLLPGRENIILTRNPDLHVEGATIMHSVEEVLEYTKRSPEECFYIIGGAQIYEQFLPKADRLYLTRLDKEFEADTFFPYINFDEWDLVDLEVIDDDPQVDYSYRFEIWERKDEE